MEYNVKPGDASFRMHFKAWVFLVLLPAGLIWTGLYFLHRLLPG